jgi:hypothetical protein
MYPAISEADLIELPFASPDEETEKIICDSVRNARAARQSAIELLAKARAAVELAVEKNEASALHLLDHMEG